MKNNKMNKKAFTLAEATTVLVLLGIIAAITIPTLITHQREVAERAKLKKAWEICDFVISTMRADHPMMTKEAFIAWANQPNCPNTVSYFKTVKVDQNNGCVFKTPDGVWFDISDMLHPEVSLGRPKTDKNTFTFVVSYDANNLTFKVNDPTYSGLTSEEKEALRKLFAKLDENITIRDKKWLESGFCYQNGYCEKYEYDDNGHLILTCYGWDDNGNCERAYKHDYDAKGNQIAYYECYNPQTGEFCVKYMYEYDEQGRNTKYCYVNSASATNCSAADYYSFTKYDNNGYTINGSCDTYDGNTECYSVKYSFDKDAHLSDVYYNCDGNGNSCEYSYKTTYDDKGNELSEFECDGAGKNCEVYSTHKYTYDANGNVTKDYSGCDAAQANCRSLTLNEYDSDGNITKTTLCDGNGANCYDQHIVQYENNRIKLETRNDNADGYGRTHEYTYNANGDVLTDTETQCYGGRSPWCYTHMWEYTYDEYGNLTREVLYNSHGGIEQDTPHTYIYK